MSSNPRSVSPLFAYAVLGWLLGTFPPIAIILFNFAGNDFVNYAKGASQNAPGSLILLPAIPMCSIIGALMGFLMGKMLGSLKDKSWSLKTVLAALAGILWAILTGGLGGGLGMFITFLFTGASSGDIGQAFWVAIITGVFGAVIGAAMALVYGFLGFALFGAVFHSLEQKRTVGMIAVCLIAAVITLILTLPTMIAGLAGF